MKYKRPLYFILLTIFFVGGLSIIGFEYTYGLRRPERLLYKPASQAQTVLGSVEYVDFIRELANKMGSEAALARVKIDVGKYGYELDGHGYDAFEPGSTVYQNNLRLYRLISYLVYRIGHIDMDTHYFRNMLNRAPKTLREMLELNSRLTASKRWRLLSVGNSAYHLQGKGGIYNLKFISADGFCEAVYNRNGKLLTQDNDPINMGTFNYGAGIPGLRAHEVYDIDPYLKWGNTPNSPQKGSQQIMKGVKEAMAMYNGHSTSVEAYRSDIMRTLKPAL